MYDYLQIIGLPRDASPRDVRLAIARRVRRMHPDFVTRNEAFDLRPGDRTEDQLPPDHALNFVEMAAVVRRMQAAFFAPQS